MERHGPSGASDLALALALAAGLVALALISAGGVDDAFPATAANTWTEIAVTVCGAAAVGALLVAGAPGRRWGLVTVALMAALTALQAASIAWSYLPDSSWLASGQALAYLAAFTGAVCLARLVPQRWPALVGGVAIAMTALCGWSLVVKVFPSLTSIDVSGRLEAPFGYWNAVGVCAAIGLPAVLWAGARRDRRPLFAALAAVAACLLLTVDVLSYSRSADAATAIGVALWLVFAPLRLRSVALLALGALGAAVIAAWVLEHGALKDQGAPLSAQIDAGHPLGLVIAAVLIVVGAAAWLAARRFDRTALSAAARRRIGWALVGLLALAVVAALGAVASSSRGLTGEVSHAWHDLVSSDSTVSGTAAGRVFQFGSSRPGYWHQAIEVGIHHLVAGVGLLGFSIARLLYTRSGEVVVEAHGYLFEVFADLGVAGVLLSLALLGSWLVAAARPLAPRLRWSVLPAGLAAEREGMIALAAGVVAFGVQSALDWTWFFIGVVVPVLLCAGWLAGRGPLQSPAVAPPEAGAGRERSSMLDRLAARPAAAAALVSLVVCTLLACWLIWRPLRSAQELSRSVGYDNTAQAFSAARAAASEDPLAVAPRAWESQLYLRLGDVAQARAELVDAIERQPHDPATWLALAQFDAAHGRPGLAIAEYRHLLEIDHTADFFGRSATAQLAELRRREAAR